MKRNIYVAPTSYDKLHIIFVLTFEQINFTTLQPLYNTVCYNMILNITLFKDGSQKCIDYIEKWP